MATEAKSTRNTSSSLTKAVYGAEGGDQDVFRIINAYFKAQSSTNLSGNKPYTKFRTGIQDFLNVVGTPPKTNIFNFPASATVEFGKNINPIEPPDLNNIGICPDDKKVLKVLRRSNISNSRPAALNILEHIVISSRDLYISAGQNWKPISSAAHIPGDTIQFPYFSKIKHIKQKELVILESLFLVCSLYPDEIALTTEAQFNPVKAHLMGIDLLPGAGGGGALGGLAVAAFQKVNFCVKKLVSVFSYNTIKAFKSFMLGAKIDGHVRTLGNAAKGLFSAGRVSGLGAGTGGTRGKKIYTIEEVLEKAINDWNSSRSFFDQEPFSEQTKTVCFQKYLTGSLCEVYTTETAAPGAAAAAAVDIATFQAAAAAAAAAPNPALNPTTWPAGLFDYINRVLAQTDARGLFLAYSVNTLEKLSILEDYLRNAQGGAVPVNQSNFCFFIGFLNCLGDFINIDYGARARAAAAAGQIPAPPAPAGGAAAAAAGGAGLPGMLAAVTRRDRANPIVGVNAEGVKAYLKKAYDDNMTAITHRQIINKSFIRIISSWNIFILNKLKASEIDRMFFTDTNTSITGLKRNFYEYLAKLRNDYNSINAPFNAGNFLLISNSSADTEAAQAAAVLQGQGPANFAAAVGLDKIQMATAIGTHIGAIPVAERRSRRNRRNNRRNTRR
jgi:hypothetical protein